MVLPRVIDGVFLMVTSLTLHRPLLGYVVQTQKSAVIELSVQVGFQIRDVCAHGEQTPVRGLVV